jgi:hypothetical protein
VDVDYSLGETKRGLPGMINKAWLTIIGDSKARYCLRNSASLSCYRKARLRRENEWQGRTFPSVGCEIRLQVTRTQPWQRATRRERGATANESLAGRKSRTFDANALLPQYVRNKQPSGRPGSDEVGFGLVPSAQEFAARGMRFVSIIWRWTVFARSPHSNSG